MRKFILLTAVGFISTIALCSNAMFAEEAKPDGETAALQELYRIELLPKLSSGETCKMFSSYDRKGGNDDGFEGTYSKLRVEDGNSVLAEMDGPGCIQRIWFTHSDGTPGLLNRKGEHVRIYLDGDKTPALDVPLEDIFSGKLEAFPKPLVGESQGGFYCYVPIPYKKSCKLVVDGTGVRFVQIGYRTFASDAGVTNYRYPPTQKQQEALALAAKAWIACGDIEALGVKDAEKIEKPFVLKAGESLEVELPRGPRMVRAVYLKLKPEQKENANSARLQIAWDGAAASVDLPVDFFFCQAKKSDEYRSLLAGATDRGWYNFMPMPYRKSAKLSIKAEKPLEGTLTLLTTNLAAKSDELGYFHTAYNESLPTQTAKFHPYLIREGRGRFVGTYLVTDGEGADGRLPIWLEGDEQFTCDGELRIHGTGTEDGFNCGWYALPGRLNGPGAAPLAGFPVYRVEDNGHVTAAAFRWYLTDPVAYEKTIAAELEHGGSNDVNANYRTVGFYYDAAP